MKLALHQLFTLKSGLEALDGYDKIVKDGERDKTVRALYQLGGGLRLSIAKTLNKIEAETTAYDKARNELIRQYANGGAKVPDDKLIEFMREQRSMLDAEVELDLKPIKVAELKLDENPIPVTVLSALVPMLDE